MIQRIPEKGWARIMGVRGKDASLFASLCLGGRTNDSGALLLFMFSPSPNWALHISWLWSVLAQICTDNLECACFSYFFHNFSLHREHHCALRFLADVSGQRSGVCSLLAQDLVWIFEWRCLHRNPSVVHQSSCFQIQCQSHLHHGYSSLFKFDCSESRISRLSCLWLNILHGWNVCWWRSKSSGFAGTCSMNLSWHGLSVVVGLNWPGWTLIWLQT